MEGSESAFTAGKKERIASKNSNNPPILTCILNKWAFSNKRLSVPGKQ
jgi:hypothetical protein